MNKWTTLFSALLLLSTTANAEGFYVGGSFGAGDATLRPDIEFGNTDDRMYLAKGFGGFRVNDFLAVEGSLVGASNDDYYYDDTFDGDVDVSFGAVTASFLGIIPAADNFELYAKLGGYLGESEVDCFFFTCERNEDESGMLWGAGAFMHFGSRKQFTIRFEYEEFDTDVFDDLWAVSAGFQYNF